MTKLALVLGAALLLLVAAACGQGKEQPQPPTPAKVVTPPVKANVPPTKADTPPTPVAAGDGTVFAKRAPAVGDKSEDKVGMTMAMETSVDVDGKGKPQKATMEKSESETRQEEVLAVKGEAATKVKVTFVEKTVTVKEEGKERKRPSPVAGKTYVVEAKDGKLVVLLDGDRPAPPMQAKVVKEAYETLGKVDPLYAGVPGRPLKPGDKVEELAKAMKEIMLTRAKEMEVSSVNVVFKGVKDGEGVFEVEVALAAVEKPMRFDMKLKGEARVSLTTGQPISTNLKGPMSVGSTEGEGARMKISGTGSVEMTMERKKL
ncbi:MAG: hypothetical protein HY906_22155 [Deltaproteobacteria bacterium]|nr:hypothetical protein [Deltaproteobacteria bacterium]